jgi:hypothetical protein
MCCLVIDGIGPLTEEVVEIPEGPDRTPLGIHRRGHEPRLFTRLGVPQERVNELRLGGSKEPLHDRAKARLSHRARFLGAGILGEQALEIDAVKFFASIHYQRLGQAVIPTDTDP